MAVNIAGNDWAIHRIPHSKFEASRWDTGNVQIGSAVRYNAALLEPMDDICLPFRIPRWGNGATKEQLHRTLSSEGIFGRRGNEGTSLIFRPPIPKDGNNKTPALYRAPTKETP